jgi:hypothetical protein
MRYPNGRHLPLHFTHMLKTLARPHHFHNIILTPLRFKYLYQARKVSDRAFCVLVISIFSKNFLLHFGNILTVWYFCCSFYFNKIPWAIGSQVFCWWRKQEYQEKCTHKVILTSMKSSKIPKGKSKIKAEQTIQMAKRKRTKGQTTIYKTQHPLQTFFVNITKCQSF